MPKPDRSFMDDDPLEAVNIKGVPEDIGVNVNEYEKYPVHYLGEFSRAALDIERIVQAPMPIIAASILTSLATCAQGKYDVNIPGYNEHEPLSIFSLVVAGSIERKSAVDGVVYKTIDEWLVDSYQSHKQMEEHYDVLVKDAKKQGQEAPDEPRNPYIITSDTTVEGMLEDIVQNKYGTFLFKNDEAAEFFGGWNMRTENRTKAFGTLSKLYNGKTDRMKRKGTGELFFKDRRLSVHLQGQPDVVSPFLRDKMAQTQGILGRFIISWCNPRPAAKRLRDKAYECASVQALYEAQMRLVKRAILTKDIDGLGKRREVMKLTPEADDAFDTIHDDYEQLRVNSYSDEPAMNSFVGRAAITAVRIGAVLAAAHGYENVSRNWLFNAKGIVDWHISNMERGLGLAQEREEDKLANELLAWCKEKGKDKIYTALIQQYGPSRFQKMRVDDIKVIIAHLDNHGHLLQLERGYVIDGKERTLSWVVL